MDENVTLENITIKLTRIHSPIVKADVEKQRINGSCA